MNNFQTMSEEDFQALLDDWDEWDRRERENDIPDELKTIEGYGSGWKEIEDFPDYEVSVYGEVYSKKTKKILSPGDDGRGRYPRVVLCKDKKMYTKSIHKLMAKAFLPNPENKSDVNHINGDSKCNRLSNLEWNTHAENMKHAYEHGLVNFPVYGGNPKKKIRIVETGQIFDSISECSMFLNGHLKGVGHICDCLYGKRKTHRGYHFEEVV